MDECINAVGYETIFSTLDGHGGYVQVQNLRRVQIQDSIYVAPCPVLPCVQTVWTEIAPGMFQHAVDVLLAKANWQFALVH